MNTATTSVISWNRRSAESTADHATTSEPISRDGFLPQVARPVFTLADAVTAKWFSLPISRPHFPRCCCLGVTTYTRKFSSCGLQSHQHRLTWWEHSAFTADATIARLRPHTFAGWQNLQPILLRGGTTHVGADLFGIVPVLLVILLKSDCSNTGVLRTAFRSPSM